MDNLALFSWGEEHLNPTVPEIIGNIHCLQTKTSTNNDPKYSIMIHMTLSNLLMTRGLEGRA